MVEPASPAARIGIRRGDDLKTRRPATPGAPGEQRYGDMLGRRPPFSGAGLAGFGGRAGIWCSSGCCRARSSTLYSQIATTMLSIAMNGAMSSKKSTPDCTAFVPREVRAAV